MSLKLYKSSSWWYADFLIDGQRKSVNLEVKVRGVRPKTLRLKGDAAFEASRLAALRAHDAMKGDMDSERSRIRMMDRLRGMAGMDSMKVEDLPKFVEKVLRGKGATEKHVREVVKVVRDFSEGLSVDQVDRITRGMLRDWWAGITGSARTRNKKRGFLKMLFLELVREGYLERSPAEGLRGVSGDIVHREPFSEDEVAAMLAVAGPLRPLLVVCLSTALRRADAVRLDWKDVNLEAGWVRVKTSKTGEWAEIPMSKELREVFPAKPKKAGPVFPDLAKMHLDTISDMFLEVRKKAGIVGRKDLHSFRVTWITRALAAGVPMEVVRRVTGHQTVEVVIKHYFRPGREEMRKALLPVQGGAISPLRQSLIEALARAPECELPRVESLARQRGWL